MALYQWGTGACGCIDGEGRLALPSGGALVVNPKPAQSGTIRLPNGGSIKARKVADDGDLDALQVNSGNDLLLGGPFVSANRVNDVHVGGASSVSVSVAGAERVLVNDVLVMLSNDVLTFSSQLLEGGVTIRQEALEEGDGAVMTVQAQDVELGIGGNLVLRAGRLLGEEGSDGNVVLHDAPESISGQRVMFVANAIEAPEGEGAGGGGILYAESGAGKWFGGSGTVTTFGPAEPHCDVCGRDFVLEWQNARFGHLVVCMWCLTDALSDAAVVTKETP